MASFDEKADHRMPDSQRPAISTASHIDLLGGIHIYGGLCFVVFGFIYLLALDSTYMFVSNQIFALLCALNWYAIRPERLRSLKTHVFLSIVYIGLVNVVVHIGAHDSPLIYWGLSVPIAAAFILDIGSILVWIALGFGFLPLTLLLKRGLFAFRTIPLSEAQVELLTYSSYAFLLLFLAYSFFLFKRKLSAVLTELNDKKADLENLIRVVCHDLGGPAMVLSFRSRALSKICETADFEESPRVRNECERILKMTSVIEVMLEDVRKYTRLASGKVELRVQQVNLREALVECLLQLEDVVKRKGVRIEVPSDAGRDATILFNQDNLIQQVLANVLSNAIKFSPQGETIHLSFEETPEELALSIKDRGIGIPPALLRNIFSIGEPTSRPGTDGERGTGFGLPIVKAYMEKYKARITVESKPDSSVESERGTMVKLFFRKG